MAAAKPRGQKPVASRKEQLAAIRGLGVRVHTHPLPRCSGGKHDASCAGKGSEVNCAKVTKNGISFCVCSHFKL